MQIPPRGHNGDSSGVAQLPPLLADPPERSEIFHRIVAAQQELLQARGRVLEARTGSDVAEVRRILGLAREILDHAQADCARWVSPVAAKSETPKETPKARQRNGGNGGRTGTG
jgi:hypothetical protein